MVAPGPGVRLVTVGAFTSAAVRKLQVVLVIPLPAVSLIELDPPVSVAVYWVAFASGAFGLSVAEVPPGFSVTVALTAVPVVVFLKVNVVPRHPAPAH